MNSFYQTALSSSTGTLKEQAAAIDIVETELNRAKRRLKYLEMEKNNKIRLVEINQYYGDKYAEHTSLMKVVIFTLVPIIILTIIYNKGFLPSRVYYIIFIIIGIIGAYYFWKTYTSIIIRDNMNYNEYNWAFNASSAPKGSPSDIDPWGGIGTLGTCIGEACCQSDQTYDNNLDQCITGKKKESFDLMQSAENTLQSAENVLQSTEDAIYNGLTQTQKGKFRADVDLKNSLNAYNV
jgi:hypothetical protein